jgi:sec-independent protein translocase protein TatB
MLDIGWSELVLIGVVALIVVGPKDLPRMFHTLGRFTAKARSMGREFQRAMDDAAKTSGFAEAAKDIKDMTSKKSLGIDALENAASSFEKWNPTKPAVKPAAAKPDMTKQGPATQALAEKRATEAAERKATLGARQVAQEMADDMAESSASAEPVAVPAKANSPAKPAVAKAAASKPAAGAKSQTAAPAKPVTKAMPVAKPQPAAAAKPAPVVVAEASVEPPKPRSRKKLTP